jgi:Flp pilus assembly protein CpaB
MSAGRGGLVGRAAGAARGVARRVGIELLLLLALFLRFLAPVVAEEIAQRKHAQHGHQADGDRTQYPVLITGAAGFVGDVLRHGDLGKSNWCATRTWHAT